MSSAHSLRSIQCLRAVAAIVVMFCHVHAVGAQYHFNYNSLFDYGRYGVDLFFTVSGFIMVYTSWQVLGDRRAAIPFLFKRAVRIYPIYWQFTLLLLVLYGFKTDWVADYVTPGFDLLKSFLLWPQSAAPFLNIGWTLMFEMYFYVVFCLLFVVPRAYGLYFLIGWAALLLLSQALPAHAWTIFTSPESLEFIAGCLVAWAVRCERSISVGFVGALAVFWLMLAFTCFPEGTHPLVIFGLPCAMLVYAAVMLERRHPRMFTPWLARIGDASYSIYLSHSLIFMAVAKTIRPFTGPSLGSEILYFMLSMGIAIGFGLLNYRLVEQPIARWYHRRSKRLR